MDVATNQRTWTPLTAALACAALCGAVQFVAATFWVHGFDSPNFATRIARNLAERGAYSGGAWWRLKGSNPPPNQPEMRAFHLPGEPLYLAAGFRWLPASCHRYLHVPVTALLAGAVAYVAASSLGIGVGLVAGCLVALQPFVILHGPVWDDIFLGTALEWMVLALLLAASHSTVGGSLRLALLFTVAGWAAVTRSQSQAVLGLLAAAIMLVPKLRPLWRESLAILVGMTVAVGGWGIRNRFVLGEFLLGSTHDGITLWESNYPAAMEALLTKGQVERLNSERMTEDFANTAHLGEIQADRYFRARATRYIAGHPMEIVRSAAIKLWVSALGVRPEESVTTARNLLALISNFALAGLGLAGIWGLLAVTQSGSTRAPRWTQADVRLVLVHGLATFAITIALLCVGPVGMRYRLGFDVYLSILAATPILRLLGYGVQEKTAPENAGRVDELQPISVTSHCRPRFSGRS